MVVGATVVGGTVVVVGGAVVVGGVVAGAASGLERCEQLASRSATVNR